MYKSVRKQNKLYQEVVNHITDLVLRRSLKPGDKLPPESELTKDFGVSRTALREAMKALEQKGLVEVKQGCGTFVRNISPKAVTESFTLLLRTDESRHFELSQIREILEVEIVGSLAETATEQDLESLTQGIEQMRQALGSPEEFAKEDVAFHMATYRAMKNQVLMTIMQPITELLLEAMEKTFQPVGAAESSLRRHEQLVERIRERDSQGARRLMREIISRGEERLRENLKKDGVIRDTGVADHDRSDAKVAV